MDLSVSIITVDLSVCMFVTVGPSGLYRVVSDRKIQTDLFSIWPKQRRKEVFEDPGPSGLTLIMFWTFRSLTDNVLNFSVLILFVDLPVSILVRVGPSGLYTVVTDSKFQSDLFPIWLKQRRKEVFENPGPSGL